MNISLALFNVLEPDTRLPAASQDFLVSRIATSGKNVRENIAERILENCI